MSDTVWVTYVGPSDEVEIPLGAGASAVCKQGESVEVPTSIARGRKPNDETGDPGTSGLLDQSDTWTAGKAPKPAPPPAPTPTTEETSK